MSPNETWEPGMVQSIQMLVESLRPHREIARAKEAAIMAETCGPAVGGPGSAPIDMKWALSGFAELDRDGRVLRFYGHDHTSQNLRDAVEGYDLFREVAPAFEANCLGRRYRTIARGAFETRFAETIDVRIAGEERHVHVVLSFVPELDIGYVFIRTFTPPEAQ